MPIVDELQGAGFALAAPLPSAAAQAIAPMLAARDFAGASRVLIVGNHRALWPRFLAAYHADAGLAADPDPFDRFVEVTLGAAIGARPVRFAHRAYDGAYVPLQRLAVAAGLGVLSCSQLVIHPMYGPWWSLRAVIGLGAADEAAPVAAAPACDAACEIRCAAAYASGDFGAVRAACTAGGAWRYSDQQLAYHDTHDRRWLARR